MPSEHLPRTSSERPLWQRMLRRRLAFLGATALLLALLLGGTYLFAPQWLLKAYYARQAAAAQLDTRTLQVGDTRWSYYEGGEGPTLVLLHGFAADKTVWLPVAKELGAHFHLVIPDLPGWGDSSRQSGASYSVEAQAARLQAWVDAAHLQRFVLVGHSLGGAIAGVYASEHPGHVTGLALVDSYGLRANPSPLEQAVLAGKHPFYFGDRAGFAKALSRVFVKPPHVPGRIADVFVARNRANHAFIDQTLRQLRQPAESLVLQHRLDRLSMPVLGVWCRQDRVVDPSAMDSLRDGLTGAPAISASLINGCNHVPMLEKPQGMARILTGFALSH